MHPQQPAALLRSIPWLAKVAPATLDTLARQSMLHLVPAGSRIFEQAETPSFATVLIRGRVELLAIGGEHEMLVELVAAPDILLPAAVLNQQPYLLRARVLEKALLLLIAADAFRGAVMQDHP